MKTPRIQYVDSMRGLAMIMVVIWHVFTMSLHCETRFSTLFNWVLQMPLFVMISGFFCWEIAKLLVYKTVTEGIYPSGYSGSYNDDNLLLDIF